MDNEKPYKIYRGVGIYRHEEIIVGSEFRVNEDGSITNTLPAYDVYFTLTDGSMRSVFLKEIKEDIDSMLGTAEKLGMLNDMVRTLNEE